MDKGTSSSSMSDRMSSEGERSMRTGSFSDAAVEGFMSCSMLGEWMMCAVWRVSAIWMPASWRLAIVGERCVFARKRSRLFVVKVKMR